MQSLLRSDHLADLKNAVRAEDIVRLLESYSILSIKQTAVLKEYHDHLLFLFAFPPNQKIRVLAETELSRISEIVQTTYESHQHAFTQALMGSGIAGTEMYCSYSHSISLWMSSKFGDLVELGGSDADPDVIRNTIQALLPVIEFEKSSQRELNLTSRLKYVSGRGDLSGQLKWLLQLIESAALSTHIKEQLYAALKVYVRWKLDEVHFSRTTLQLPVNGIFYHTDFIKSINSRLLLQGKLDKAMILDPEQKRMLSDTMKASLALINRETDPVTYADDDELESFQLGRGVQIVLVGMKKERRLSLESYVGYMAFKNGVPVSYGGGWIWGQRCKIGVNIYAPFRKGESAWLFCQIMRVYYQYFGVRNFMVKPYQFGKANPEGIKTGAFWFYYKLGFRPVDEKIRQLANEEWIRICEDKKYRTSIPVLKKFTGCNLEWRLSDTLMPAFEASALSARITDLINQGFKGDRQKAIRQCLGHIQANVRMDDLPYKTDVQKKVLESWCLLILALPDFNNWTQTEKAGLVHLIQLKIMGRETDYIYSLQKHDRFWKTLDQQVDAD